MKSNILTHTIAALLVAAPITQADEKKDGGKSSNASATTAVVTSSDGTATVTIDINGKKETRTFKLGDGNNAFSFSTDGDGAKAAGVVGVGGGVAEFQPPGNREKGPWIGIAMEPVPDVVRAQLPLAAGEGVVINHVAPESPAAKAGLEANDILLRFEDQIVFEPSQLRKLIAMKKPGESVELTYMRKGERKETSATLVEHELEPEGKGAVQFLQGMPRFQGGNDAMRRMEEQLKQFKEKHPGIIVDKWSWSGGGAPGNREQFKGMLDEMRKNLEKSELPQEEQAKIRKSFEEAMENARRAMDDAMKDVKRFRQKDEEKNDAPPKKPGAPL